MSILLGIALIILGFFAGTAGGLVGIGGGVIIVPALIYIFGMSQQLAQGTTLAILVPPVGILAAITYYKAGYVDIRIAALICIGFVLGAFLGSKMAIKIPTELLSKIFAISIIVIGIKMLFQK